MHGRLPIVAVFLGLLCPVSSIGAQESEFTARPANAWPTAVSGVPKDAATEQRVASIVATMSLEDKVGQMIQAEIQHVSPADAARYGLGSVLNGGGSFPGRDKRAAPSRWFELAAQFESEMRRRSGISIPILWGTDAVHGHNNVFGATLFPHNIGLGASGDPDLAKRIAEATAREVRATGIHWVFAPTLAVARDIRWGRTYESLSSEPGLVRKFGDAFVIGFQGTPATSDFLGGARVIATAKHFIGDGGTAEGIDQGNTQLDDEDLSRIHAPGYYAAIAAGVQTVMVSFSSVNGEKMHGHRRLLTDVLKGRLGFDGIVVSDWNGIGQVPGCTNSSCPQAINAGIDMIMAPEDWRTLHQNIVNQVRSGVISAGRIDDAVTRILRVKARAGMIPADKANSAERATPERAKPDMSVIGSSAHRALAREAVRKSLVLLKNDRNVLPLKSTARLRVIGNAANDVGRQSGGWTLTWQGSGNERSDFPGATSIFEGLQAALAQGKGSAELSAAPDEGRPDALLVVVGEEPYAEGEGDLASLEYSVDPSILQTMAAMRAKGVPVVTVFVSGRPRLVNPLINASDAFVAAWLPGSEGAGVADLLVGDSEGKAPFDFQGRLPFAWPTEYPTAESPAQVITTRSYPVGWGLTYQTTVAPGPSLPEPPATSASGSGIQYIFDRRPVAPSQMFIGDQGNWRIPVTGPDAATSEGILSIRTIDRKRQGDSRQIEWNGRGEGIVYFETTTPRDFSRWLENGGALAMDVKVDRPPTKSTFIKAHCSYPCGAQANITTALRRVPKGEWVRLSIDFACFVKSGLDASKVTTIPLFSTAGELSMAVSNIRLIPGISEAATFSCSNR